MPNWVANRLVITGPEGTVSEFAEAVRSTDADGQVNALDFERTLPTPAELTDGRPDTEYPQLPAWRQWRSATWGTKWNAQDAEVTAGTGDGAVVYRFTTAWAPPEPWLLDASTRFPELEFELEFLEEYQQFCGRARWREGRCTLAEDLDPRSLEWIEWEESDEDDDEGRWWADPLPPMSDISEEALLRAAQLVQGALRARRAPWRDGYLSFRYLHWTAAISEQLGAAGRVALTVDADPESAAADARRGEFSRHVAFAASQAITAAEQVYAPGGVRMVRADLTPRLQEALDGLADDRDRAWSGSTPLDWLAELFEEFGYVSENLLSAELSRYRESPEGTPYENPDDEGRESDLEEAEELAQKRLISFAGVCLRALAMLAPEHLDPDGRSEPDGPEPSRASA